MPLHSFNQNFGTNAASVRELAINADFDRRLIDLMFRGHGHELAELTSKDLLDNGEIELRQWIMMLGAIGNHKPQQLVYEPFYRGVLGMAVGYWDLEAT